MTILQFSTTVQPFSTTVLQLSATVLPPSTHQAGTFVLQISTTVLQRRNCLTRRHPSKRTRDCEPSPEKADLVLALRRCEVHALVLEVLEQGRGVEAELLRTCEARQPV